MATSGEFRPFTIRFPALSKLQYLQRQDPGPNWKFSAVRVSPRRRNLQVADHILNIGLAIPTATGKVLITSLPLLSVAHCVILSQARINKLRLIFLDDNVFD
jgi:hypothetical protein